MCAMSATNISKILTTAGSARWFKVFGLYLSRESVVCGSGCVKNLSMVSKQLFLHHDIC